MAEAGRERKSTYLCIKEAYNMIVVYWALHNLDGLSVDREWQA